MNELILNKDGSVTCVGDGGAASGILDDLVKANTTPAVLNDDGSVKTDAVVPNADTLAVEVTRTELKTHAWRLPVARTRRLGEIRANRNDKLAKLDLEYQLADEGVHPDGLNKAAVAAKKQALRDLPPVAEAALAELGDTDAISGYDPLA